MSVYNPHGALVRATFSRAAYAADELRVALPAELVALMDLSSLELRAGWSVDEALRDHYTELLFSASIDKRPGLVHMVFEHDPMPYGPYRQDEAGTALHIWRCAGRIWHKVLHERPGAGRLPLIVPLVVRHGHRWPTHAGAVTSMDELMDATPAVRDALGSRWPGMGFYLDDLSTQGNEELRTREMAALPRLVLWALRNGRGDIATTMRGWADVFWEVGRSPGGVQDLAMVLRYLLEVSDAEPGDIEAATMEMDRRAREAYMTAAESLQEQARDQGREQGRMEGRIEGRVQGRVETLRGVLHTLLEQRFGPLPHDTAERIDRGDADELARWIMQVVDARSLDTVFAGPGSSAP